MTKILADIFRLLAYIGGGLFAAFVALWIYASIPRSIGEVQVDRLALVAGSAIRKIDDLSPGFSPGKWLRLELSSSADLTARGYAVGGVGDLYIESNCCPMADTVQISPHARGPFPDDMRVFLPDAEAALVANSTEAPRAVPYGYRQAVRKADGRYHYTAYIDADDMGDLSRDLRIRIIGAKYFAPRAESRVLTIPSSQIRQALRQIGYSGDRFRVGRIAAPPTRV